MPLLYDKSNILLQVDIPEQVSLDQIKANKILIGNELVKIINELPNLDYYKLNNQR